MPLTRLFVDLNSYFASVEQQEVPKLRGKPVAVIPVETDSTCCIAASYEAKAHGVKTGTSVRDARRMCPELALIPARPAIYVRYHHAILAAAESVLPVEAVHSIDEFSCRLRGADQARDAAVALAYAIKRAIASRVGECLRCSIGIAPNRVLAKLGTDMQKPDGLVVIEDHELPSRLFDLKLTDLHGIGARTALHLQSRGVHTMEQLCALDERAMERLFGSIVGRWWHHWLRGRDLQEQPTRRRSIGHQHVLPPKLRNDASARAVAIRLLHKAAARARHLGYWAQRLDMYVKPVAGSSWKAHASFHECQDTLSLVQVFCRMWDQHPPWAPPMLVGVTLQDLVNRASATMSLFDTDHRRADLARAMDRVNMKHGRDSIYLGVTHDVLDSAPTRIAFTSIPDLSLPETSDTEDGFPSRRVRP